MPHPTAKTFLRAQSALTAIGCLSTAVGSTSTSAAEPAAKGPVATVVGKYCYDCHDSDMKKGGLSLEALDQTHFAAAPEQWENVVRKLDHRLMPPLGEERP